MNTFYIVESVNSGVIMSGSKKITLPLPELLFICSVQDKRTGQGILNMLAPFNETVSQDLQKVTTGGLIFEVKHWTLSMFCQIIMVPQFQHFTLKCCYLTGSSIVPNIWQLFEI